MTPVVVNELPKSKNVSFGRQNLCTGTSSARKACVLDFVFITLHNDTLKNGIYLRVHCTTSTVCANYTKFVSLSGCSKGSSFR